MRSDSTERPAMCWRTCRRAALLGGVLSILSQLPARAQSIDFSAMQQLFGEPVTTSATGSPLRASAVPANMVIITADQIRQSGFDNIPDILRLVPGVDVRRNEIIGADVGVRGYDIQGNGRLLVLLNGRPVFDDFFGSVIWGDIPVQLDEIRQIEVVKGPGSALFGFNAASGAINIVTFDPLYDKVDAATVRTGTQALAEGSLVGTVNTPRVAGIRMSIGGIRANEFGRDQTEAQPLEHPVAGSVGLDGAWQPKPDLQVRLEGNASNDYNNNYQQTPLGFESRTNSVRASVASPSPIGELTLDGYRNERRFSLRGSGPDANEVYDIQATDLLKIGAASTARFNLEFKDDSAASPAGFGGTGGYLDEAANAMWSWQLLSALSFTNAIRVDHLTMNYHGSGLFAVGESADSVNRHALTGISFNSGLVWQATEHDTARLLLGRGLALPSMVALQSQSIGGPGVYFLGNPALQPTAVTSIELSGDHEITRLATKLTGTIYAERNDDLSVNIYNGQPVFSPHGIAFMANNVGHSDEAGLELAAQGALPFKLSWSAYYTYGIIRDHLQQGLPLNEQTSYQDSTPLQTALFGIGYHAGRLEADLDGRWQSHYVDYPLVVPGPVIPQTIHNYVSVNTRVGYKLFKALTVAVSAQQLLQRRLVETLGPRVDRRVIVSATLGF